MLKTTFVVSFAVILIALSATHARAWEKTTDRLLTYDRTNPPPQGGIVFTGSSSIEGWRTLHADFPDLPVVNRGIGGARLEQVPLFAPKLVYPLKPRAVVIYGGENDLGAGRSADDVAAAFKATLEHARNALPAARIIYVSIKPSPHREHLISAMREANAKIAALCAKDPLCTFVDIFTPMLDAQGKLRSDLYSANDRLHMNPEGYKLWAKILRPVLKPADAVQSGQNLLQGWKIIGHGDWKMEDGAIHGTHTKNVEPYGHLVSEETYSDFTLRLKFKALEGNSGVYFRIDETGNSGVSGFQAEVDTGRHVGGLYETNGRGWVVRPTSEQVATWFRSAEWNDMLITARAGDIDVYVNGIKSAELRRDPGRRSGKIALQLHGAEDVDVWFKDVQIQRH